jgi:hypothetical protein
MHSRRFNETCNFIETEKYRPLYEYLSNEAIGSCGIPCSIMDINFGYPIIDTTNIDEAYVKLYFKMAVQIHKNILAYSTLSFLAEVGGYIGLLLGFSLLDLSKVIKNLTPCIKKCKGPSKIDVDSKGEGGGIKKRQSESRQIKYIK